MNGQTCSLLDEELTYTKGGNNMKTKMKKIFKNQKGMTLIELLAVIVIIAIIALIAIPAIAGIINKSHDKAILSDASQIISGAKIAISDGACTAGTGTDIGKYTCNSTKLAQYVEGVTLKESPTANSDEEKATVIKTSAGYELEYTGFSDFKTDEFKGTEAASSDSKIGTSNKVTDKQLAKIMGNN